MLSRHLLNALLIALLLPACDSKEPAQPPKESSDDDWFKTGNDVFVTKHRYRVGATAGWKVEFWLWGSTFPHNEGVDMNFRVTPENHQLKNLPPITVSLAVSRLDKEFKVRKFQPVIEWQECAKMAARAETTYENGKWGRRTYFPPKALCWEGTVVDAFQSPSTMPFEPGDYLLHAEIIIESAPKIEFRNVEMKIYKGFEPPVMATP